MKKLLLVGLLAAAPSVGFAQGVPIRAPIPQVGESVPPSLTGIPAQYYAELSSAYGLIAQLVQENQSLRQRASNGPSSSPDDSKALKDQVQIMQKIIDNLTAENTKLKGDNK